MQQQLSMTWPPLAAGSASSAARGLGVPAGRHTQGVLGAGTCIVAAAVAPPALVMAQHLLEEKACCRSFSGDAYSQLHPSDYCLHELRGG